MILAHQMTSDDRRIEAFALIDEIKSAIAGGRSFTNADVSEFFVRLRDRLKQYGPHTRVSPDELSALRRIAKGMKGKRQ